MAMASSYSSSLAIPPHLHFCHFLPVRLLRSISKLRIPSPRRARSACSSSCTSQSDVGPSWIPIDNPDDGFGGWFLCQPEKIPVGIDVRKLIIAGIGTSVTILLVSLAHFSFARKGFRFQLIAPFPSLSEVFRGTEPAKTLKKESRFDTQEAVETMLEEKPVLIQYAFDQTKDDLKSGKNGYKMVPVVADSTQQQALSLLQKLKIIESDAKPYVLCTRREYARWLVKANSLLERDPKHRIVPSMLIAGSTITAFDDVNSSDPDFLFIQAIGESGIVPSRLSAINHQELDDESGPMDKYVFSPESLISRLDLISWKAKLEYPLVPGADEKMLRKSIGFMDLRAVSMDVLQELFMDTLAGERSILRRVFGICFSFLALDLIKTCSISTEHLKSN